MEENNSVSIPQPIVQQETNIPVESKPKTNSTPFFIILIILLICIIGYLFYQNFQLKKYITKNIPSSTPIATTSPTPLATNDPTANWKIYNNTKYNISFKYPIDWKFVETKEPDIETWVSTNIFQLISPNASVNHGEINGGYYLVFDVAKPDRNYSNFQEFLDFTKNQYKYTLTAKNINNINGYLFTENTKNSGFLFTDDKLFYTVNYITDKDQEILDQILSTFKFTQ